MVSRRMGKDFNYLNGGNGLIKAQETIIRGLQEPYLMRIYPLNNSEFH